MHPSCRNPNQYLFGASVTESQGRPPNHFMLATTLHFSLTKSTSETKLTIRFSLLNLLRSTSQAPLFALQDSILLRQSMSKVFLEGAPYCLRAGLTDTGLLCASDTQLFQPCEPYQRVLIYISVSPVGVPHAAVQKKRTVKPTDRRE
jgi:hypothetical protein